MLRVLLTIVIAAFSAVVFGGELLQREAILFLDFKAELGGGVVRGGKVRHVRGSFGGAAQFRRADDHLEARLDRKLDGLEAITVGGWFFTRRTGEQVLFSRGMPEIDENGMRRFPPQERWVNFVLGTEQRGFLMGTINGNGAMPFPYVTVDDVQIDAWHQLVVVKDREGAHHFHHNGTRVHSTSDLPKEVRPRPLVDKDDGEPVRLAMPHGGLIGEAWIYGRALDENEIHEDYLAKRERFKPAIEPHAVELREMNAPRGGGPMEAAALRRCVAERAQTNRVGGIETARRVSDRQAAAGCEGAQRGRLRQLRSPKGFDSGGGGRPDAGVAASAQEVEWARAGGDLHVRHDKRRGEGRDGRAFGRKPKSEPVRNLAFAIDIVEAGFVALAPDYLRDGERTPKSGRPYDTTEFYERHPDWSIVGKDVWDNGRAVDYLQTLEFVDSERIGMTGHSYGGHSTIFAAALEPRIKVVAANGPVSDFLHHGMHWAVPKGGGASQSLPNLRPFVLDHTRPLPVTFYEFTSLVAPRPLWVGQAAGEHRPMDEENYAAVREVYAALDASDRVKYYWYAGDHDFPPATRRSMVAWFRRWFDR